MMEAVLIMKLRRLEVCILIFISLIFTYSAFISVKQDNIASGLLRLHVLANSNTAHDQQIKLLVRDEVLKFCEPILKNADDRNEVYEIMNENMQTLANIAQKTLWDLGENRSVYVSLKEEYYPTRDYTDFSLPAGEYLGLRVIIGEGEGKNWWCVVFPPMCNELAVSEKTDYLPKKCTIRFKTAEVIGEIRNYIFG